MTMRTATLIDQARNVLAIARVADEGNHFCGKLDLQNMPAHLRALFEEFEEAVNGQMFSLAVEIQAKIGSLPIEAVFENGQDVRIRDFQVFPSTGDISFRLAEAQVSSAKSA